MMYFDRIWHSFYHPDLTDPSTKKPRFMGSICELTSRPENKPTPKSVFHSCIWASESLVNAVELLYVLGELILLFKPRSR
jgi:hypothetical protein